MCVWFHKASYLYVPHTHTFTHVRTRTLTHTGYMLKNAGNQKQVHVVKEAELFSDLISGLLGVCGCVCVLCLGSILSYRQLGPTSHRALASGNPQTCKKKKLIPALTIVNKSTSPQ